MVMVDVKSIVIFKTQIYEGQMAMESRWTIEDEIVDSEI